MLILHFQGDTTSVIISDNVIQAAGTWCRLLEAGLGGSEAHLQEEPT